MKIEQNLLKKLISEQVQEELEKLEEQGFDMTDKMTPDEQIIDSLLSSLAQMGPKFQKILELFKEFM